MLKGLLVCLIVTGASAPAMAEERDAPVAQPPAPVTLLRDRMAHYVAKTAPLPAAAPARFNARPQPFMLPANSARLQPQRARGAAPAAEPVPIAYDFREPSAIEAWGLSLPRSEATSTRGGSYAVRDIMNAQPKPRKRGSPLAAAFVLRLDGKDDSPPFSVGGGGVAAALWKVVPKQ
jgi:hypothetical protein